MTRGRRRACGVAAVEAALDAGASLSLLLVERTCQEPGLSALVARAERAGAAIWRGAEGDLRRMSPGRERHRVIGLLGDDTQATLGGLFERGGAVWLLHRAAYPSNVGFAIRTAEVSGADGVVVDGAFNHDARSRVRHVSMGADRLLPVVWESSTAALAAARHGGFRVIALEASGASAPWEVDLRRRVLLVIGNERDGIEPELLTHCDAVIGIPMAGFVPSYNVQAALSAVAVERLRQLSQQR